MLKVEGLLGVSWLRIQGLGFRVQGSGFRVYHVGAKFKGLRSVTRPRHTRRRPLRICRQEKITQLSFKSANKEAITEFPFEPANAEEITQRSFRCANQEEIAKPSFKFADKEEITQLSFAYANKRKSLNPPSSPQTNENHSTARVWRDAKQPPQLSTRKNYTHRAPYSGS